MEPDPLLDSLRNAVTAMPDDVPLRLHLAALLLRGGQRDEAVRHLGAVLQREPGNGEALAMLTTGSPGTAGSAGTSGPPVTAGPLAGEDASAALPRDRSGEPVEIGWGGRGRGRGPSP